MSLQTELRARPLPRMRTHTPGFKRATLSAANAGYLGGHPTRLKVVARQDTLLTRVAYMLRSEARIRPVWFDAVRKFPPLPFGAHTRVKDLPNFKLPEDRLATEYAKRHHGASWVEKLVPINRRFADTIRTPQHQQTAGSVAGQRFLSPAYEFARRQHYLMRHKGVSEADARATVEKSFSADFASFDRARSDRLLQRAVAAGAKLSMSLEEAVGEERAVLTRLFDHTVTDYTLGSTTYGKSLPNVLVGGGAVQNASALENASPLANQQVSKETPKVAAPAAASTAETVDDMSVVPDKFFEKKNVARKSVWGKGKLTTDKKKR